MTSPVRACLGFVVLASALALAACDMKPSDPKLPSDPSRSVPTPTTSTGGVIGTASATTPMPPASAPIQ